MYNLKLVRHLLKQFPFIYPKGFIKKTNIYIDKLQSKSIKYNETKISRYYLLEPQQTYFLKSPRSLQIDYLSQFTNNQAYQTSVKYLYFLNDVFVVGNEGITANSRNFIFEEFTHNFNVSKLKFSRHNKPFANFSIKLTELRGTCASLLFPQSQNIYHWLFDVLARVRFYTPVIKQIDYFLVAETVPDSYIKLLGHFGIAEKQILKIQCKKKYHIQYLYISTLSGSEGRSHKNDIDFLISKLKFNFNSSYCPKKIYLTRGSATYRKIVNDKEISDVLLNQGFSIVDSGSISFEQQRSIFSQAEIVISYHGAALFNLLFVPESCKVLELFSPDYFRTDCYYNIAGLRGLEYWYLVGEKNTQTNWGDAYFNPSLILETLNQF